MSKKYLYLNDVPTFKRYKCIIQYIGFLSLKKYTFIYCFTYFI